MTRTDWRVLWRAVALMEPGNYLYSNAALLSEVLGISYVTTLGSWRKLREMGLLIDLHNRLGRLVGYRVNPAFAWRGRPWKADMAQHQIEAQRALDAMVKESDDGAPATRP